MAGPVAVTMADVQVLINQNPLAAEQLKGIALERLLAERDTALAAYKARAGNGNAPVDWNPAASKVEVEVEPK